MALEGTLKLEIRRTIGPPGTSHAWVLRYCKTELIAHFNAFFSVLSPVPPGVIYGASLAA